MSSLTLDYIRRLPRQELKLELAKRKCSVRGRKDTLVKRLCKVVTEEEKEVKDADGENIVDPDVLVREEVGKCDDEDIFVEEEVDDVEDVIEDVVVEDVEDSCSEEGMTNLDTPAERGGTHQCSLATVESDGEGSRVDLDVLVEETMEESTTQSDCPMNEGDTPMYD